MTKWPNRYSNPVALRSVALRRPGLGGVSQENLATPPEKGPVAPPFSALKGGVAVQGGVAALPPVALAWAAYGLHLSGENLVSRWEGVRLPQASGKSPDFLGVPPTSPEVFGDFRGSSLTCGTKQQSRGSPEVSQTSPEVPGISPEVSRTSPEVTPLSGKPETLP